MKRLILVVFFFLFIQNLFAQTTYFVKTDGNDANNGLSWATAKASIQGAYDASSPDDVILVKYGTYNLSDIINIDSDRKITSDDGNGSLWIDADYDYSQCILDGSSSASNKIMQMDYVPVTNNCIIRGFTFTNAGHSAADCALGVWSCDPIIEYCYFYNNNGEGIFANTSSIIVRSCKFEANSNNGIRSSQGESTDTTHFVNNLVVNSNTGCYSTAATFHCYNSTFINCEGAFTITGSSTFRATNVIVAYGNWITYNNSNENNAVAFRHCNFFNNGQNTYYGTGYISKTNVTYDDPKFIGSGDNPYALTANSPCLNVGFGLITDDIGAYDILGNNRFYNTIEDIGAYEFQGEPATYITYKLPADDVKFSNTSLTKIYFSFNRKIIPAGGNISLYRENGSLIKSIASNSADVTINIKDVTVQVNESLSLNTNYYVTIAADAFEDNVGKNFAGISNSADWNFSVGETDISHGNCLSFDGIDDYVNLGKSSVFRPGMISIEMWVYFDNWDITGTEKLISNTELENGHDGGYNLQNNEGTIKFAVSHSYGYRIVSFDASALTGWHHITGTTDDDLVKIYLDGELKDTYDNWYVEPITYEIANALILGAEAGVDNTPTDSYFSGKMDEIHIWKSCRTQQEIRDNMFKTLSGTESNLIAYFQCNGSTGTVLSDRANGRGGLLNNMTDNAWAESGAPVSGGICIYQTIENGFTGSIDLSSIDMMVDVNSKSETTNYIITKHENAPNSNPANVTRTYDRQYWLIHQFGTGSYNIDITFTIEEEVTEVMEDTPEAVKLYFRPTSSGDWTFVKSATYCDAAANNIHFDNITQTGQFVICRFAGAAESVAGNMLKFDGTNDYLAGYGLPHEFSEITLEAWVYPNSLTVEIQRFISLKNEIAVLRYDGSSLGGPGQIHFYIKTNGTLKSLRTSDVLRTGEWQHVAGTWDGTTMKIYRNGELLTSSSPGGTLDDGTGEFNISNPSESVDGFIEEIRIHSKALSDQEIREGMHITYTGYEESLTAYWQMNDDPGSTFATEVTGGYHGDLYNMDINNDWYPSTAPVGGGTSNTQTEASGIIGFTGTNVTMNYDTHNSASVTVTKINNAPNITPGDVDAVFDNQYWVINRFGTGAFNVDLTFTLSGGLTASDEANPLMIKLYTRESGSDGDWTFLKRASSVNASTGEVTFNDISSFSQFIIVRKFDVPAISTNDITGINTSSAISGGSNVEAYGTDITGKGVCWSTSTNPTIADAHTSDGTGLDEFESSISGLSKNTRYYIRAYATNSTGTAYGEEKNFNTPNQLYNMLDFDGANDYVSTPITLPNQGTIEFWFKVDDINTGYLWTTTANHWYTQLANGNLYAWISGETGGEALIKSLSANTWYHCAITWLKAGISVTVQLFINGTLADFTSIPNSWGEPGSTLTIGKKTSYFNGKIDEFRIWNTVRTETQIRDNMHKFISPASDNLMCYYNFDNSSGSSISDGTSGGYNGTLNNMLNTNWLTSTAPIGVYGTYVRNTTQTSTGQTGKTISATISSGGDDTNYLGIYTYGDGDASIDVETFPDGITQRTNFIWGVREFGSCTADLVFDYSGIVGATTNESSLKLMKRSNASSAWTDVTGSAIQNTDNHTFTMSGITSFSEFSIGDGGTNPLPVELSSFTANVVERIVKLTWKTATEVNNYGFEIERAIKNSKLKMKNWEALGFVDGAGNSNSTKEYSFTDENIGNGKYIYRLKQIDNDGGIEYSNEVEIDVDVIKEFALYQNYPNPFNPVTKITFAIPIKAKVNLAVYDILGRQIATLADDYKEPGRYEYTFDASSFASGVYVYRLTKDNFVVSKKMLYLK